MKNYNISLYKMQSTDEDISSIAKVLRREDYWACGPEIEQFENKLKQYIDANYCLTFNSGTSALFSIFKSLDIAGYDVICPSFTFIASANCITAANATPVFVEVEEDTFGIDFEDLKKKVNKKTKAILLVHFGGCPARDTLKIRDYAKLNNILLIEDAAQSYGAKISDKFVGSFGFASMFSLCQNKIITTGEGGFIVTADKKLNEKLKLIRSHGRVELSNDDYFKNCGDNDYVALGYNFRMPTICAALGLSQFKNIDKNIQQRAVLANIFFTKLSSIKDIEFQKCPANFKRVFQMFTIKCGNKTIRDNLQSFLKEKGIMSKVYFNPIHLKTFYVNNFGYKNGDLPITESLSNRVLTLPFYPNLNKDEIEYITSTIILFFGK